MDYFLGSPARARVGGDQAHVRTGEDAIGEVILEERAGVRRGGDPCVGRRVRRSARVPRDATLAHKGSILHAREEPVHGITQTLYGDIELGVLWVHDWRFDAHIVELSRDGQDGHGGASRDVHRV